MFFGDIVCPNGKTVYENNMELSHNIPLGQLVEIVDEEYENRGVRLFVVNHMRDFDGEPLYTLSFNKNIREELAELPKDGLQWLLLASSVLGGISKESLQIV